MKKLACRLLLPSLIVLLFPFSIGAQKDPTARASTAGIEIPFRLYNGFLIAVEGRIGDLHGLKFILDTGTTHSVIDRRIADRFTAARRPKKVFNFDGFVSVDLMEFPDVHFGPIEAHHVSMMVTELAKSSDLIPDADAIIGLDMLNTARSLSIFYDSKMVVLRPRDVNTQGVSEREKPECFTVEARVQGHSVRLLLDTGMEGILLYEDRIRQRIPSVKLTDERKGVFEGRLQGKTARLPGFRVVGPESDVEVFLMKGPRPDLLPGIDGYLGTAPLKAKSIELDFERKIIRWQ